MYKVLLVEDEPIIRKGLQVLINDVIGGFIVSWEAENGARALDILNHDRPDVLITDIRMAKINGLTLIEKVKNMYPSLPIVIISGYDEFEYAKKAIQFGVDDYLLKPINRLELTETMEKVKKKCDQMVEKTYNFNFSNSEDQENEKADSRYVLQVKEYILKNIDQELTLQSVSNQVNAHPNYISQLFKEKTGQNFSDYIREVRLKRAKQLLEETNLKVYEIARLSGYQSDKHFTRLFKLALGETPKKYRDKITRGKTS